MEDRFSCRIEGRVEAALDSLDTLFNILRPTMSDSQAERLAALIEDIEDVFDEILVRI